MIKNNLFWLFCVCRSIVKISRYILFSANCNYFITEIKLTSFISIVTPFADYLMQHTFYSCIGGLASLDSFYIVNVACRSGITIAVNSAYENYFSFWFLTSQVIHVLELLLLFFGFHLVKKSFQVATLILCYRCNLL